MFAVARSQGTGKTQAEGAAVVSAVGIGKAIDERPILRGVDLDVPAGEYVALLGRNGAGKSTLLRILATLLAPSDGELRLFGEVARLDRADLRRQVGMIGHQPMLYRDLSARENLWLFGRLYGVAGVKETAEELLERVGLRGRADDAIKTYSRGMVQRASIARALMHDPRLLLADEPFAGLDAPATAALERLLADLHQQGRTIVLAGHDVRQCLELARRVVVLRDGRKVLDEPSAGLTAQAVLAEVCR